MRPQYEDHLFSQGYFVARPEAEQKADDAHPAEALLALAHFAEIRITQHPELADLHMVEVAARNIGEDVPLPFMRGFPQTARELSPSALLFDQLVHYLKTYGLDDFSEAGHSLFEDCYERTAFSESTDPKRFAIVTADEAERLLQRSMDGFWASTRPLNDARYELLLTYIRDHGLPKGACACKDTVCRLIIDTRDPDLGDLLALPDVIRLVEWIVELGYEDMRVSKLNLRNRDRKLVTAVLDRMLERSGCDIKACFEKRRAWNGLLHHIHYQPTCDAGRALCDAVRGREMRSAYSEFEQLIQSGDVGGAAAALRASKGSSAVLRRLVHLLSRCSAPDDVDRVLEAVESDNKIVLIQLLNFFSSRTDRDQRVFKFVRMNKAVNHVETYEEAAHRKSILDEETAQRASSYLEDALRRACHGTLGKVYVDEKLKGIALPLQEAASMGGFGTLPRGSRIALPECKKLRAFVYWEQVDDIDLSCFGLNEHGDAREFSWRTMADLQSDAILFSGDQTSGYHGGSEYFDIDFEAYRQAYPDHRFILFSANVYTTGVPFSECRCRAGYMLRDTDDSGEVFEPRTVESAFAVTCRSAQAHLFAIDLETSEFVWINVAEESWNRVAAMGDLSFLLDYLHLADAVNLYDFACMLATEVVEAPDEADTVFSDDDLDLGEGQEQVRSRDIARVIELLNA